MQTKKIPLKGGEELEVDVTDEFLALVRGAMGVPDLAEVSDDHIVDFIYHSFKHAVDKEEINEQEE
jgi:hypothetical protein